MMKLTVILMGAMILHTGTMQGQSFDKSINKDSLLQNIVKSLPANCIILKQPSVGRRKANLFQ